jgi:hypothetical protein
MLQCLIWVWRYGMKNFGFFVRNFMESWYWYVLSIIGIYQIYKWYKEKVSKKRLIIGIIIISFIFAFFSALYKTNKFEMQRRANIIKNLLNEYKLSQNGIDPYFPETPSGELSPKIKEWLNKRLMDKNEDWKIE